MRKILVLTPRFPYPLYGGDLLRIYRLCENLAKNYKLTLVSICQSKQELSQILPKQHPFENVHRIYLSPFVSYWNTMKAIFSGECLQIAYYRSPKFAAIVDRLSAEHDIVMAHLLRMAPYVSNFTGTRIAELTDHLPSTYSRSNQVKSSSFGIKKMVYNLEMNRIDRAQNELAKCFDLITFVSEVDRDMFLTSSGMPENKVRTFSNGITLDDRPFQSSRSGSKIAFIGNMNTVPNEDGALYFINTVKPTLKKHLGEIKVKLIGVCSKSFRHRMQSDDDIELTGPVASIASAVSDCAVGICPIRIGSGIQNKILDYMALGLPCVTTSLGAEGLAAISGRHLLIADDPDDFAEAILSLIKNQDKGSHIAAAARQLMESQYTWEAQLNGLYAAIDSTDMS